MITPKTLISLVTPVFNEVDNIDPYYERVNQAVAPLRSIYEFELVFTDNGSTDGTFRKIKHLAGRDPMVRGFRFSRNFGYQKSIFTGYSKARGEAAIQLDVDLQDPPELIATFLAKWREGHEVVYGIRRSRQESRLINAIRRVFYRLINLLSEYPLPSDVGDFRLVDRRILRELAEMDDRCPYLRGSIATMGFSQVGVPYDRAARVVGKSKFNFKSLLNLAIDGIVSHSILPLRFATYTGLFVAVTTFIGLLIYLVGKFAMGASWPPGFATVTVLILFSISLNGIFLGIIGEYLSRIYLQLKRGPITIIAETTETSTLGSDLNSGPSAQTASIPGTV